MKTLKSLQELWSYCLFCPICQDITRDIQISVGPDDVFSLSKFEKKEHTLYLKCIFNTKKKKYYIKYNINCLDNTFTVDISNPISNNINVDDASLHYFYFYIHSDCRICNASHANSKDIELDLINKIITNIGIEREGVYILSEPPKYYISYEYDNNIMQISKCIEDEYGGILDDNKIFTYSIIDFDFSNIKNILNKIKLLLVFS